MHHCMCLYVTACVGLPQNVSIVVSVHVLSLHVLSVHVALMHNAKGIYAGMQEQAHSPHSVSSPVRRGSALGPSPLSMKGRPSHGHSSSMGSISMGSNKSLNARQGFNQVCSQPHLAMQLGLWGLRVLCCVTLNLFAWPAILLPLGQCSTK